MTRNDAIIEDAIIVDTVGDTERPKRLHPQLALWLARGLIFVVIGTGALMFKMGPDSRPGPDARDAALFLAATNVRPANAEPIPSIVKTALRSEATPRSVETSVLLPSLPLRSFDRGVSETVRPPEAEDLRGAVIRAPRARAIAGTISRPHRSSRHGAARSARSVPRPLSIIARGAKRTVRTVRFAVSRLF